VCIVVLHTIRPFVRFCQFCWLSLLFVISYYIHHAMLLCTDRLLLRVFRQRPAVIYYCSAEFVPHKRQLIAMTDALTCTRHVPSIPVESRGHHLAVTQVSPQCSHVATVCTAWLRTPPAGSSADLVETWTRK
jgi:hypothetical protein